MTPPSLVRLKPFAEGTVNKMRCGKVMLWDVRVGMVLADDVRLLSGLLLASPGYEVTSSFAERARNFRDSVDSKPVRVVMPREERSGRADSPIVPS